MTEDNLNGCVLSVKESRLLANWVHALTDFIEDEYVIGSKADLRALKQLRPKLEAAAARELPAETKERGPLLGDEE